MMNGTWCQACIIPGPHPTYEDGDIVCVFTKHRIRLRHAEGICWVGRADRNSNGLLRPHTHVELLHIAKAAWKMERISRHEVRQTSLVDGTSSVLTSTPNVDGHYIWAEEFIRRRKQKQNHALFGEAGRERWYAGQKWRTNGIPDAEMDAIWQAIETHTPEREVDYRLWPATDVERRHFGWLSFTDMTEPEADHLCRRDSDNNRRRACHVRGWWDLPGVTPERWVAKESVSDIREVRQHAWQSCVMDK